MNKLYHTYHILQVLLPRHISGKLQSMEIGYFIKKRGLDI